MDSPSSASAFATKMAEEISRLTEDETMVRPPKTRILAYGTKIEVKTAVVDGVKIEYWRAVQMYATSYSPCRSGVDQLLLRATSSGKSVRKGMVGLRLQLVSQHAGPTAFHPRLWVCIGGRCLRRLCGKTMDRPGLSAIMILNMAFLGHRIFSYAGSCECDLCFGVMWQMAHAYRGSPMR